jgi:hypothetical protein
MCIMSILFLKIAVCLTHRLNPGMERRQAFATVSVSRLPITSLIVATREAQKCCEGHYNVFCSLFPFCEDLQTIAFVVSTERFMPAKKIYHSQS